MRSWGLRNVLLVSTSLACSGLGAGIGHAQSEAGSSDRIDEIVVTATRREESLQAVPVAVTALDGSKLAQSNITGLESLPQLAPSLQIMPQFTPGSAVFQIRGQLQSATSLATDSPVGVYFDDVYIARSPGSLLNFVDIARVEVLKGPQGTLFGRNTAGGAIRIISQKPTDAFEGYIKGGYSSFDTALLEGVVNIPLTDGLAFRAAGQYENKDGGYSTNLVNGDKIDRSKNYFVRGSLQYDDADRLNILVQADYTKTQAGGIASYLQGYSFANAPSTALSVAAQAGLFDPAQLSNPAAVAAGRAAGNAILQQLVQDARNNPRRTGTSLAAVTGNTAAYDPVTRRTSYTGGTTNPFNVIEVWGTQGTIAYDFGFAMLKSITSYRKVDYDAAYELDGTAYDIIASRGPVSQKQWSQEMLLNGEAAGGALNWTVGGIYFDEKAAQSDRAVSLSYLQVPFGIYGTRTVGRTHYKSWGVFAQGTYKLTDLLSLTGGLRYSRDDRSFKSEAYDLKTSGVETCSYTAASGLALLPIFTAPCQLSQSKAFDQVSYTASLQYQLDPSKMVYARTSRGYLSGGFNARVNLPEVLGGFDPEVVTDYEIGLKADWLDGRLRTNIAAYVSHATDVQQSANGQAVRPDGTQVSFTRTTNIGTRNVHGVEVEAVVKPARFLIIDGSAAFTDGEQKNPQVPDVDYLPAVPKWTVSLGGTLSGALTDSIDGRLRIDMSYRSSMLDKIVLRNATGGIDMIGRHRGRTLVNARLTLHETNSGVELALLGTNLFNEKYESRVTGIGGLGIVMANLGEPRALGAQITVPFGKKN